MCPRLSANYVSCCPPNMAQVSVWAGNLQHLTYNRQTIMEILEEREKRKEKKTSDV